MGYAYELNICKFDLELYKLVGVNFMAITHVLMNFLKPIQNLFSFSILSKVLDHILLQKIIAV